VTLISVASGSCTKPPTDKKLPAGLAVGKLKQLCKRLFGLDTDLQVPKTQCCSTAWTVMLYAVHCAMSLCELASCDASLLLVLWHGSVIASSVYDDHLL
jgi:hypothetical protein